MSKCVVESESVRLTKSSSSLVPQLYQRSSEDRRPLGQLQNNESLKSCPGLLCVGNPPLMLLSCLPPPPSLSPLPQPTDTGVNVMSASHAHYREAALGNRGNGVQPGKDGQTNTQEEEKRGKEWRRGKKSFWSCRFVVISLESCKEHDL